MIKKYLTAIAWILRYFNAILPENNNGENKKAQNVGYDTHSKNGDTRSPYSPKITPIYCAIWSGNVCSKNQATEQIKQNIITAKKKKR